jgi:hypothetical protein
MAGLQQVQDVLERVLGAAPLPFHIAFWRGRTRDELVATEVLGQPLIVVGRPEASPLVQALRGAASGTIRAYFGSARAEADDLAVIEQWIRDGCPEVGAQHGAAASRFITAAERAGDEQHTAYWRAMDFFFHPSLASPITRAHVLRLHGDALAAWLPTMLTGADPARWPSYLAQANVTESFAHVRHHQRRLLQEYYTGSQEDILDSLWKFGGSLLPIDPTHPLPPIIHHRMNGVLDWFLWVPYVDASLRAADAEAIDLDLARGWQIGIVADGLLRTDNERPVGERMPISDFTVGDPDLRSKVVAKYVGMDAPTMIGEMVRRAGESNLFS